MCCAKQFKAFLPAGSAIMFESLYSINLSDLLTMIFLLYSDLSDSDLNSSRADVMED